MCKTNNEAAILRDAIDSILSQLINSIDRGLLYNLILYGLIPSKFELYLTHIDYVASLNVVRVSSFSLCDSTF